MTGKKTKPKKKAKKRQPPLRIPMPFHKAVDGILGLSAGDAKAVRDTGKKKGE